MRVWKQWSDEAPNNSKANIGRRKMTSAPDDQHLIACRVRRYAVERCVPECAIERHSGLIPAVMPKVFPFLQGLPGTFFQQDNACPYVSKTARDSVRPNTCNFFLGLLIMCGIWLVGILLVIRILQLQKTNFLCTKQAIWNTLLEADIQTLFNSMPRRIAALIAACDGYTKY
ncbi:hypothetical protein TNCV_1487441 [Trichonephila clavipes]|nr:hypothetical protein TNCV_1487441 [Trichonephila clavipes]